MSFSPEFWGHTGGRDLVKDCEVDLMLLMLSDDCSNEEAQAKCEARFGEYFKDNPEVAIFGCANLLGRSGLGAVHLYRAIRDCREVGLAGTLVLATESAIQSAKDEGGKAILQYFHQLSSWLESYLSAQEQLLSARQALTNAASQDCVDLSVAAELTGGEREMEARCRALNQQAGEAMVYFCEAILTGYRQILTELAEKDPLAAKRDYNRILAGLSRDGSEVAQYIRDHLEEPDACV